MVDVREELLKARGAAKRKELEATATTGSFLTITLPHPSLDRNRATGVMGVKGLTSYLKEHTAAVSYEQTFEAVPLGASRTPLVIDGWGLVPCLGPVLLSPDRRRPSLFLLLV